MVWTTVNGTEREFWDYVGRMESFDYAAQLYEHFNGSAPDCGKISEINAAFAQGRMYFEKREVCGPWSETVAPVLRSDGPGRWTRVVQIAGKDGGIVEVGARA